MIKKFFSKKLGTAVLAMTLAISVPQPVHSSLAITSLFQVIAEFIQNLEIMNHEKQENTKQTPKNLLQPASKPTESNSYNWSSLLKPWSWRIFTWFFKSNANYDSSIDKNYSRFDFSRSSANFTNNEQAKNLIVLYDVKIGLNFCISKSSRIAHEIPRAEIVLETLRQNLSNEILKKEFYLNNQKTTLEAKLLEDKSDETLKAMKKLQKDVYSSKDGTLLFEMGDGIHKLRKNIKDNIKIALALTISDPKETLQFSDQELRGDCTFEQIEETKKIMAALDKKLKQAISNYENYQKNKAFLMGKHYEEQLLEDNKNILEQHSNLSIKKFRPLIKELDQKLDLNQIRKNKDIDFSLYYPKKSLKGLNEV